MLRSIVTSPFGIVCASVLTSASAVHAAEGNATWKPVRPPKYEHFRIGVFVDSAKERALTVPLTKVFTDFLTHGVEFINIGSANYFMQPGDKSLNTYAKANGVQMVVWLPYPEPLDGPYDEAKLRSYIKGMVDQVNSRPDADAVVAWRSGDEIEVMYYGQPDVKERRVLMAQNMQRFSDLLREIDPTRRVVMNHAEMPNDQWIEVHEDEAWASTGVTGIYNSYRVREQIAQARRCGFDSYILVAQAHPCPLGTANLRWYGYREPVNDEVIKSRTVAQHVQDYAETAYLEGALGIGYFLYWAGGSGYETWTLVDLNGDDYLGKWDAVQKAARNIRKWEGAPSCAITGAVNHSWTGVPFTLTVEASAPAADPVTVVKADLSLDGAFSWTPLPDATEAPYRFTIDAGLVKELPSTVWVRTRALNQRGPSLWDVIELRCSK
jgi:hypothetical protein